MVIFLFYFGSMTIIPDRLLYPKVCGYSRLVWNWVWDVLENNVNIMPFIGKLGTLASRFNVISSYNQ